MNKKYFCTAPWVHIHTWPNGTVFPCRNSLREFENVGNLYENTIEEIWNGEKFKQFRQDLLDDVARPEICGRCYENEAVGHRSLREYCNENFMDEFNLQSTTDTVPARFYYWDFRFDNTCNQACRSCGPQLSSAWYDDHYKVTGKHAIRLETKFTKFRQGDIHKKLMDDNLPYVKEINFAGGESTITEDHYYILSKLVELNRNDVVLTYTTNLSSLKFKDLNFLDTWAAMKRVKVMVSIDDVMERGEYWRHGLEWKKFYQNLISLRKLSKEHPNVGISYGITVSVFNVHRLLEITQYLIDHDFADNTTEIDYNSAICFKPHFDVVTLSNEQKIECINRIEITKNLLDLHGIVSTIDSVTEKLKSDGSAIIEESQGMLTIAANNFAKLDVIRNQSLKEVAPELYEIYSQHGYDEMLANFKPYELPR